MMNCPNCGTPEVRQTKGITFDVLAPYRCQLCGEFINADGTILHADLRANGEKIILESVYGSLPPEPPEARKYAPALDDPLVAPVGIDAELNQPFAIDLTTPLLIERTDTGKPDILRSIVKTMAQSPHKTNVYLYEVSEKSNSGFMLKLDEFAEMRASRIETIRGKARHIKDWNKKYPTQALPYELIALDLDSSKKWLVDNYDVLQRLKEIAIMGRGVGLSFIVATDSLNYTRIPLELRANVQRLQFEGLGYATYQGFLEKRYIKTPLPPLAEKPNNS